MINISHATRESIYPISPRRLLISLLLFFTAISFVVAQGVTAHDIARLRAVGEVMISPDGTLVAYTRYVPRNPFVEENGPAWAELLVTDPNGTERTYVGGHVNVSSVQWLPDGKSISFLARRGTEKRRSLYAIPVAGGEAVKLLEHQTDISSYAWSPDGKSVAFLAAEAPSERREKEREQGFNQEVYEEENPRVLVWIAEIGSDGTNPHKLDLDGSASELHWSPAGPQLAVALAPTPLVDDDYMQRRVHVLDAGSGKVIARVDNPGKLGSAAWSPDGLHLALISGADINDPMAGRLMVADARSGLLRDLLPGYQGHVSGVAWQDSQTIMFIGDEGVSTIIGNVNHDGSAHATIVGAGGPVLSGLSLARDGAGAAFAGEAPGHPLEAFYMRRGDRVPRRLTHSNNWLEKRRLGKQEIVRYKARDGLEIEGILIRPLDEQPGIRYPLILSVHGGPESHHQNGWLTSYSNPGQVAAARGFAVFYPNYRGSTGRGVEFSELSQGDPAGKEFDDLVDGVDHLVEAGLVDRDKVGITGGSYGGYASAWGATYFSERFAASVVFVGISDKVSKVGTTDIANEEYLVHARKRPWDNWQFFLERSPIYHAGKSRTPTLIMHGKDDPRVHPSQSLELYRHLKLRSKAPVRLVLYPAEGHGNRRAAARLDYNLRMLQWMEHYLIGPGGDPPPLEIDYKEAADGKSAE